MKSNSYLQREGHANSRQLGKYFLFQPLLTSTAFKNECAVLKGLFVCVKTISSYIGNQKAMDLAYIGGNTSMQPR